MNKKILKTGVQDFIEKNWNTDIVSVLLRKQLFEGVSQKELAEQLEAKKKCRNKLPTWFKTKHIYYPNKLNVEQTSSEQTAKYKAGLVSGKSLLDVTGGLGVDSYYFSKRMELVIHCESQSDLSKIVAHNFKILGAHNIKPFSTDGIAFLTDYPNEIDWVYLDPSRRNEANAKVFRFKDTLPNVPKYLDVILSKTENVMVKASPLLDISLGVGELTFVKEIQVVAVNNEMKELLFILQKGYNSTIGIKTINLLRDGEQSYDFTPIDEKNAVAIFSEPKTFLYEPNAAILKSGGFKSVGNFFGLKKLHEHSHLYTGDISIDFPGRRFKVHEVLPYRKSELKALSGTKANITTRNFSESVLTIRKKLKIKDGGTDYLFFTTDYLGNSIVIKCVKV